MYQFIFTHGSLMNRPPFSVHTSAVAVAPRWQRTFGHPSVRNWGTKAAPAPTSALIPGDGAVGVAHLVGPAEIRAVIDREASEPQPIEIVIDEVPRRALTWTMTSRWSAWSARRLATAAHANVQAGGGPLGDALGYLDGVIEALALHGRSDPLADRYRNSFRLLHGRDEHR